MPAACEIASAVGGFYFTENHRFRFHLHPNADFTFCKRQNISLIKNAKQTCAKL